MHLYNKKNV